MATQTTPISQAPNLDKSGISIGTAQNQDAMDYDDVKNATLSPTYYLTPENPRYIELLEYPYSKLSHKDDDEGSFYTTLN